MADDRIVIEIELDDGSVKKAFLNINKAAKESSEEAEKNIRKPRFGLSNLAKMAGIAVAAFGGFKAITKTMGLLANSIRDAVSEADAVQSLNTALALSGHYSRETSLEIQNLANELQSLTRFGNDTVISVAGLIQTMGKLEPDQLQRATKAALDLSTALRIDVNSAAQLLGKAAAGSVESLGRYGIRIQKTGDIARDFAAVLDKLETSFGGSAEAATKTASGAWAQMQNNFGDMLKELGKLIVLSPSVVAFLNKMSELWVQVGTAISEAIGGRDLFQPLLSGMVTVAAFLTASLGPLLEMTLGLGKALFYSITTGALAALTAISDVFALIEMGINKLVGTDFSFFQDETERLLAATAHSANEAADSWSSYFTNFNSGTEATLDWLAQLKGAIDATNGSLIDMADSGLKNSRDGLESLNKEGLTVSESFATVIDGARESAKEFADKSAENFKQVGAQMFQSVGQAAGQAFAAFGRAIASGENALQAFVDSLLASMGQMAIQLGTQFILQGAAYMWAGLPNGGALMAAGAALAAFGGVLSALGGGQGSIGGVGGEPVFTNDSALLASPDEIETQGPVTQVSVNIQGDVLDSRDSGMRIVDLIKEYTDRNGRTEVFA